jgi:RES domain-containing protein
MAKAWRVVKSKYAASALDGEGARRAGGRWNPVGTPALYASDSLALAMMEVLVHFDTAMPMASYVALELDLPDDAILSINPNAIPGNWPRLDSIPASQRIGHGLLVMRNLFAIAVPSVVVPLSFNYVINPAHADFPAWVAKQLLRPPIPLQFDARLLGQSAIPQPASIKPLAHSTTSSAGN